VQIFHDVGAFALLLLLEPDAASLEAFSDGCGCAKPAKRRTVSGVAALSCRRRFC